MEVLVSRLDGDLDMIVYNDELGFFGRVGVAVDDVGNMFGGVQVDKQKTCIVFINGLFIEGWELVR
jgi:hypothetical protein